MTVPTAPLQPTSVFQTELHAAEPDRLIRNRDAAVSEEIFHVSIAHAESVVQPHGVADDLGAKSISAVARAFRFSSVKSATHAPNLTVPEDLLSKKHDVLQTSRPCCKGRDGNKPLAG